MPNWCVQQLEYAAAAAGCSGVGCVIQEYFTYFTELGRWNKNYFVFWRTICCACCILPTIGELVVQFMGKRFSHVGKETGNKEPHAFMEPWALIRCSWTWTHTWVLLFQRMGRQKKHNPTKTMNMASSHLKSGSLDFNPIKIWSLSVDNLGWYSQVPSSGVDRYMSHHAAVTRLPKCPKSLPWLGKSFRIPLTVQDSSSNLNLYPDAPCMVYIYLQNWVILFGKCW